MFDGLVAELRLRFPATYLSQTMVVGGRLMDASPLCPARDDLDRACRRAMAQT